MYVRVHKVMYNVYSIHNREFFARGREDDEWVNGCNGHLVYFSMSHTRAYIIPEGGEVSHVGDFPGIIGLYPGATEQMAKTLQVLHDHCRQHPHNITTL